MIAVGAMLHHHGRRPPRTIPYYLKTQMMLLFLKSPISLAVDGNYYTRVHYFSDRGAGQVDATLKLYVSGVLEGQYTTSLVHNQVWNVAYVRWPQSYVIEELDVIDYDGPRSCF